MNKFWKRVWNCKHKNLSQNYYELYGCGTDYCDAVETRCKDCGVYIMKCGCDFMNGFSGWPEKRWRKYLKETI